MLILGLLKTTFDTLKFSENLKRKCFICIYASEKTEKVKVRPSVFVLSNCLHDIIHVFFNDLDRSYIFLKYLYNFKITAGWKGNMVQWSDLMT